MHISRRFNPNALSAVKRADEKQLPGINGMAAVFFDDNRPAETQYQLWRDTFERILPTAFDAIDDDDVRALQNHDPRLLLGRSTAGTLSLKVEKKGLSYNIDTPDTTAGRDTVTSLQRGDMTGSSFAFQSVRTTWTEVEDENGITYIRNLEQAKTFDVGPVTFPAYSGTTSQAGERSASPLQIQQRGITAIDRRSAEHELESIRSELQQYLEEHYHAPERARRQRERSFQLRMMNLGL